MSTLLKDTYYSILNNIFTLFLSFFSGMIIARILGPTGKGEFYLINQIVTIFSVLFSLGIGPSLLFYIKSLKISKSEGCMIVICYTLAILILSFIFIYLFPTQILLLLDYTITLEQLYYCSFLISLNLFFTFLGFVLMSDINGIKKWSLYSIYGNISYLLFLILFLLIFNGGIMGAIYALLLSSVYRCLLFIKAMNYFKGCYVKIDRSKIKIVLYYSFGIFVSNFFLTSVTRINTFFVNGILSTKELGIYSVAITISELLLIIPSAIGVVIFPYMTSQDNDERINTLCKICRMSLFLSFISSILLAIVAYPFIGIVFGEKFLPAYIPTLLCLPGIIVMAANYSISNYINSSGYPYYSALAFSIGLIVNIVLNLLILKSTGLNGASIIVSLSYILMTICFLYITKQKFNITIKSLLIIKKEDYIDFKLILKRYKNK